MGRICTGKFITYVQCIMYIHMSYYFSTVVRQSSKIIFVYDYVCFLDLFYHKSNWYCASKISYLSYHNSTLTIESTLL